MSFYEKCKVATKNIIIKIKSYVNISINIMKFGIYYAFESFKTKCLINTSILNNRLYVTVNTKDDVSQMVFPILTDKKTNMISKLVYGVSGSIKENITQKPGIPYKFKPEELGFDHYLILDTITDSEKILFVAPEYLEE